jgi:hypothetical protein
VGVFVGLVEGDDEGAVDALQDLFLAFEELFHLVF